MMWFCQILVWQKKTGGCLILNFLKAKELFCGAIERDLLIFSAKNLIEVGLLREKSHINMKFSWGVENS